MKLLCAFVAMGLLFALYDEGMAQSPLDEITSLAANSKCAAYNWKDRGVAPKAYMRGMALVFAKAVCEPARSDVKIVSEARGTPGTNADQTDALTWYDKKFTALNMPNDHSAVDTLRHAYVLLIGLGMSESSGKHCTGRDLSADFNGADSAEAGLFQTSWGVHKHSQALTELTDQYTADRSKCLLGVFKQGVQCACCDAINWGDARHPEDKEGMRWQRLTKTCPVFAAEYAAVVLRVSGGAKGEFGPFQRGETEVRPECDSMLTQVQKVTQMKPAICAALKALK